MLYLLLAILGFNYSHAEAIKSPAVFSIIYPAPNQYQPKRVGAATAVLLSKNLIMTNKHVIRDYFKEIDAWIISQKDLKKIKVDQIKIELNSEIALKTKTKEVSAQSIEYCSPMLDYCFLRLNELPAHRSLGDMIEPLQVSIESLPSPKEKLTLIGNYLGNGLKSEEGYLVPKNKQSQDNSLVFHCIPTDVGNSGSAILNAEQKLVALDGASWALNSGCKQLREGTGVATSMKAVIEEIPENLKQELSFAVNVIEQALKKINELRASKGIGPLLLQPDLLKIAKAHSDYLSTIDDAAHDEIPGTATYKFKDRVSKLTANHKNVATGENVACGQETAEKVVQDWAASPGHYENMMSPDYQYVGIARAGDSREDRDCPFYWTAAFIGFKD